MTTLDLGAVVGHVALETVQFDRTYVRVVRQMSDLGAKATVSAEGTERLDASLTDTAAAANEAATGLGRTSRVLTEAGVSASRAAAGTSEAALAMSRLTQASLRAQVAQARLVELQETGKASTRQLAAAQASLIAANDRVAISEERVARSQLLGAASADRMRGAWAKIPGVVKYGALALGVASVEALKASSNYQKLTVNLVTGAGESEANLKMVSDGMLHMAGAVGDSAEALAKAMFLVESAGFHGAAALTLLRTAAEGAKVDNADLTTVVDALTSAMNAYHEPATNAARVTNTLIASAAVGKMHLQDLAASLGTVLPSAAALRVPLDQVGAALATMTMQGTDAQRAATYLRFSFAALANPTDKAQKAMKDVGLTSEQVATTMTQHGLTGVFTLLQDAVGRKFPAGSAKYLAALANMVGGTRGLQAVLELTGKNLTTMNANLASIDGRVKGAGNTVSDWAQVQQNLNVEWSRFVDGLGAFGIKVGQDVVPLATDLLKVLLASGHAIGDVTKFFEDDETAASALAVVLAMSLEPALVRTTIAAGTLLKTLALGRFGAASTALKGLGIAGFASKVGVAAIAIEALNAAQDLWHLHDAANAVKASMDKPLTGNVLGDLQAQMDAIFSKIHDINHEGFLTGFLHPVKAFTDGLGFTQDALKKLGDQVSVAYGNFYDLTTALHKWPTPQAEQQTAEVIAAMGLSAKDLATKNFPQLLDQVRQWIAANKTAKDPAEQATADITALGSHALSAADEVTALTNALTLLAGNAISADQGAIAFRNDIAQLDKALHHSHGSLSLFSQAGRDARDAFDQAAQQAINTAEAQAKLKGGADKARATLKEEIQVLRDHAGGSDYAKDAIKRLTYALQQLPSYKQGHDQGKNFGQGYADGIISKREMADAAASDLAKAAQAGIQVTQKSHSPSLVAKGLGNDFGQGMADGIHESTKQVVAAAEHLATSVVNATQTALDKARSTLQADLGVRSQQAQQIQSTLLGGLDLSQAVVNGRVGNLAAFLRKGGRPIERLDNLERRLRDMGLSPKLLAQVANGGSVQDDVALALNILHGGPGYIANLDRLERRAGAAAGRTGRLVAHAEYDPRIARDHQDLLAILGELRQIKGEIAGARKDTKGHPRAYAAALGDVARNATHKAHARTSH